MTKGRVPVLRIIEPDEDFESIVAAKLVHKLMDGVRERGRAVVALCAEGPLRQVLARTTSEFAQGVDWSRVIVCQTFERSGASSEEASVHTALLEVLVGCAGLPERNLYRIRGDASDGIGEVARYEEQLLALAKSDPGSHLFDLVLLSIEADGGALGLRPGAEALLESGRYLAIGSVSAKGDRGFSLTPKAMNRSEEIWVVGRGAEVAVTVHDTLEGDYEPTKHPLQCLKPLRGVVWYLDTVAAQRLGIMAKDARPL